LTNLAIAEGTTCRFTRVVGGGMEAMATELAERREITLPQARAKLTEVDLTGPAPGQEEELGIGVDWSEEGAEDEHSDVLLDPDGSDYGDALVPAAEPEVPEDHDVWA